MKKIIYSENAPKPVGPYSQAVDTGSVIYCSGMIPIDPKTNEVFKGPVQEQAELVLKNISALLESQGLTMSHIVKTTMYLTSMADFTKVNEVYAKYFTTEPPARTTIAVAALPKEVNVEIEVIVQK